MANIVQFCSGDYNIEHLYFGFVDCNNYQPIFEVNKENIIISDLQSFKDFLNGSDLDADFICKDILMGVITQCFWSDLSFVKKTRAKMKLFGTTRSTMYKYINDVIEDLFKDNDVIVFTYCCLNSICSDAKATGLSPFRG